MPIDASIPLQVRQPQLPNPLNMLAQVMQVKGMQQDSALGAMKMEELQRQRNETNALNEAYKGALGADGSVNRNALFSTLANQGLGSRIPAIQKQFLETDKAQGDVYKAAGERYKLFQSTLGSQFTNPNLTKDSVIQSVGSLVQAGAFDPAVAQRLVSTLPDDPQQLRLHLRQVITSQMTPEQMVTVFAPKPQQVDNGQQIGFIDNNPNSPTYGQVTGAAPIQKMANPGEVMTDARTRQEGALNRSVTMRGQNLADERAKTTANAVKVPAGYRLAADGNLEFIPGGPADPNAAKRAAPTEFQGKAAMFGRRAEEADRIITQLEGKFSPMAINTKQSLGNTPMIGGALEAGANLALSDASQKAEQAQRDFVNAVLRLESGAAISESEFNNARKQYFAQPGDSPAVVAQKAQNRKTAIQGLIGNARPGAIEPPKQSGATGGWGIQRVN